MIRSGKLLQALLIPTCKRMSEVDGLSEQFENCLDLKRGLYNSRIKAISFYVYEAKTSMPITSRPFLFPIFT